MYPMYPGTLKGGKGWSFRTFYCFNIYLYVKHFGSKCVIERCSTNKGMMGEKKLHRK